jgi:squalene cyclase
VVYTQNDYSLYRLSPRSLPDEFAYLKSNLKEAVALKDPETMGELIDCLKSFGLDDNDPLIRTGTEFLLSSQNPDGSWGDMKTTDMYLRYHPTWTAVDGLRDYKWKRR